MKSKYDKKSSETFEEKKKEYKIDYSKKVEPISKGEEERLCNGCKHTLPEKLDRNICPVCGIRN